MEPLLLGHLCCVERDHVPICSPLQKDASAATKGLRDIHIKQTYPMTTSKKCADCDLRSTHATGRSTSPANVNESIMRWIRRESRLRSKHSQYRYVEYARAKHAIGKCSKMLLVGEDGQNQADEECEGGVVERESHYLVPLRQHSHRPAMEIGVTPDGELGGYSHYVNVRQPCRLVVEEVPSQSVVGTRTIRSPDIIVPQIGLPSRIPPPRAPAERPPRLLPAMWYASE